MNFRLLKGGIKTTPEVGNDFHCEEETVHMWPGELWWFNNKKTHWVKNNSKSDRIHLIIDAKG